MLQNGVKEIQQVGTKAHNVSISQLKQLVDSGKVLQRSLQEDQHDVILWILVHIGKLPGSVALWQVVYQLPC